MVIHDKEECIGFLKMANYYRFSAYFLPFKKNNGDLFADTSFERVKKIYLFDKELRALLFEIIEHIEICLRTQIAYYLGHQYGALGYMDGGIYNSHHNHSKYKDKIARCINENSKTLVVKHHQTKYNRHFPIWVIIEFFSMGMLSYLFADLKTSDQKSITRAIYQDKVTYKQLISWLRCLTDLRNRCAHYARLYYFSFVAVPKKPDAHREEMDHKLFSQIVMLKYLYPDPEHWNKLFLDRLNELITHYLPEISLKHMGFPKDWLEQLKFDENNFSL